MAKTEKKTAAAKTASPKTAAAKEPKTKVAKAAAPKTERRTSLSYTFVREPKDEITADSIQGCVLTAIRALKSAPIDAVVERALKAGLADHTNQDARVQTMVHLRRLAGKGVVTVQRGKDGEAKEAKPSKPVATKATKTAKASGKDAKSAAPTKGQKKAPRVKLVAAAPAAPEATA